MSYIFEVIVCLYRRSIVHIYSNLIGTYIVTYINLTYMYNETWPHTLGNCVIASVTCLCSLNHNCYLYIYTRLCAQCIDRMSAHTCEHSLRTAICYLNYVAINVDDNAPSSRYMVECITLFNTFFACLHNFFFLWCESAHVSRSIQFWLHFLHQYINELIGFVCIK